ncbi:MAG TPA: MG2 domain-containing protein [Gemmatimonadales bacterium]
MSPRVERWYGSLVRFLKDTIGDVAWSPPPWIASLRARGEALRARAAANPRVFRRNAIATALGLVTLWAGVLVWRHRPRAVRTDFSVTAPAATDLTVDNPKPNPLHVAFESSVAPLANVGKVVKTGVEISPNVAGVWRWIGDRELEFTPAEDWPVGQTYSVAFSKKGFVAPTVTVERYSFAFASAPFTATVSSAEFYQDPVDPNLKRVVLKLTFSHPVDTASLAKHVSLKMEGESGGFLSGLRSLPFTVSADKKSLTGSILSGPLPIPAKPGLMRVAVDAGVRSSRGGPGTDQPLEQRVQIPGLFSLAVQGAQLTLVRNERYEPEQVLMLSMSADVGEKDIRENVKAWVLPLYNPSTPADQRVRPFVWGQPEIIGPEILKESTPLTLTPVPAEREYTSLQAFRFDADPGRYIYVRVTKGLRSFGGYLLGETWDRTAVIPPFPKEIKILGNGSLLSLSGDRKISIYSRDVPALLVEVGRVVPNQLQHLVTQTSLVFGTTEFTNYNFDASNLTARQADTIPVPPLGPGKAHYQPYDVGRHLFGGALPKGLFLLSVQGYDSITKRSIPPVDRRLVLLTDLGLLAKKAADGGRDVFVQSLRTGSPLAGVTVDVVGKNGLTVLSGESDAEGHVRFPSLRSFERERTPVLYAAHRGEDLSFLPIDRADRDLDLSRFDVGGVSNALQADKLSAYLFSDRGVYRPGDTFHVGVIVKPADWTTPLAGIPLEAVVSDARGLEVKRERVRLSPQGFEEVQYTTSDAAPTGTWTVALYIVKDGRAGALLGSVTVQVREFQPDRMTMAAHLSAESADGWVSPDGLTARITLKNLFGTPAAGRRVTARVQLTPGFPTLRGLEDYRFSDPQKAKETYSDELPPATTDGSGEAQFTLGLERFARATYRLRFIAEGYEAEGGRSVTAEAGAVVSNQPFLVGYKPDGDLRYLHKDSQRAVEFVVVGSDGKQLGVRKLRLARIRVSYVSVLARQFDGTYKYQSVKKEIPVSDAPLAIAATGLTVPLPTAEPGDFALVVRDSAATELSRVEYTVAGAANLARSLERNAELQLTLDKGDYAPGETIELQVQAPYAGAGLITIERDRVYAWRWFRAATTSSVQRIPLPDGVEGNAYVSVSFVRDVNSDEVFTSPLSYGVAPFSVSLARRKTPITLTAPDLVKPGESFKIHYSTDRPSRIAIFAVDEGILQVAGYRTPDPLGFFFQKRALEVRTSQVLDLILPEFARLMAASAPGGDQASMVARNLNPFKRKRDKPVAFWSGVRDARPDGADYGFTVPEYFNGTLRVMAVAVSPDAVGAAEAKSLVRGDFVLTPNVPLMVAPGDTFEVSLGVANNVAGSGTGAQVQVVLEASPSLEVLGPATTMLPIAATREGAATFRLRAREKLGDADLGFTARLGGKAGHITASLSLRPSVPYRTMLTVGSMRPGGSASAPADRDLFPELRTVRAGMSVVPLGLAHGLVSYLAKYPYGCTEQLVSQGVPAMVLARRPEFGISGAQANATFDKVLDMLRSRQNEEGAYGLWAANTHVDPYVSVYAQHFLLDAKERGFPVPPEVLSQGVGYLQRLAASEGASLFDERTRAYAIYLLTRQGAVTTGYVMALERRVQKTYPDTWRQDLTGAFLAATYQLLRQEGHAGSLIGASRFDQKRPADYQFYDDGLTHDAMLLYLIARHFPERLGGVKAQAIDAIVSPIERGSYNSLSSAYAIMALDAYVAAAGPVAAGRFTVTETLKDGSHRALPLPAGTFPQTDVSAAAQKVGFSSDAAVVAFYLLTQAGFDRTIPAQPLSQGLEVLREYTDMNGKPVTDVTLGDELQVHLRFRALGAQPIASVALVDLLPGGFEVVENPPATATLAPMRRTGNQGGGEGERAASAWTPNFGEAVGWSPDYAEVREDRVNVYGLADASAREFIYKVKATAAGSYAVPPAYGEGMYDRAVRAWSQPGKIVVRRPK